MKKIIILLLFFLNLTIYIDNGKVEIGSGSKAMAMWGVVLKYLDNNINK